MVILSQMSTSLEFGPHWAHPHFKSSGEMAMNHQGPVDKQTDSIYCLFTKGLKII